MKLDCREQEVADHLKENRPRMYADLVRAGRLEAVVKRMHQEAGEEYASLILKGVPPNQAQEMSQEREFLPSEKDQPHLGERSPQTTAETTS
jgi:hypothetical protein